MTRPVLNTIVAALMLACAPFANAQDADSWEEGANLPAPPAASAPAADGRAEAGDGWDDEMDNSAPPTDISTSAWEYRVGVASDQITRGTSSSMNGPGGMLGVSYTSSGVVADLELTTVSKRLFPGGAGIGIRGALGYRDGDTDGFNYGFLIAGEVFPGARVNAPSNLGSAIYPMVVQGVQQQLIHNAGLTPDLAALAAPGLALNTINSGVGVPGGLRDPGFDGKIRSRKTRFDTSYAALEAGYKDLKTRLVMVLSPDFRGINTSTVCGSLLGNSELAGSDALKAQYLEQAQKCYARGMKHTRGSLLLDVDYEIPVRSNTTVTLHGGYQHIRNFSELNFFDLGIGVTYKWDGFKFTAQVTKPFTKNSLWFTADAGSGKLKRYDQPKLSVSIVKEF